MTASAGLPTFQLEGLNGRIAPIWVVERPMPAARKQTLWPRSSLAELGGFLSIAGACADGEVAPKAAVHSTGMKARAFNARLCLLAAHRLRACCVDFCLEQIDSLP